jgi:hypothetical protein
MRPKAVGSTKSEGMTLAILDDLALFLFAFLRRQRLPLLSRRG